MLGKPITQKQAQAIRKILTTEGKGKKPIRKGKTKKKGLTNAEIEMGLILSAAALLFGSIYYYYFLH